MNKVDKVSHELRVRPARKLAISHPPGVLIGIPGTVLALHQERLPVDVRFLDGPLGFALPIRLVAVARLFYLENLPESTGRYECLARARGRPTSTCVPHCTTRSLFFTASTAASSSFMFMASGFSTYTSLRARIAADRISAGDRESRSAPRPHRETPTHPRNVQRASARVRRPLLLSRRRFPLLPPGVTDGGDLNVALRANCRTSFKRPRFPQPMTATRMRSFAPLTRAACAAVMAAPITKCLRFKLLIVSLA